ncbi:MATE family efflux transporter [Enterococcus sp. LJL51]|uniref:MATE family efflux transporter n=1 Tax=Enterococcus sp. LJL51 TaxID=3416656 RepID=UPI003CEF704E
MSTTETALNKKLFFFSLPLIGSLLTQQLYSAADMVIVGQLLGAAELAAVGNASTIVLLFIVISGGIELAVEIIFSRYLGQKDERSLAKGTMNILTFGLLLGILLAVIGVFALPSLFDLLKIPTELIPLARSYSLIYLLGVPSIYVYDISRAMLISLGEANKSFYLILSSSLLNVFLNIFFLQVLHLGVAGAAWGTILSQGLLMCVSIRLLYQKSRKNPYFKFSFVLDFAQLKELSHIAVPSIFQQFVITVSSMFLQAFVNPFGNEVIIGFIAVTKVLSISRIVISGFSQTLSIFSARMFAGKKLAQLKQTYTFLTKISLLYSGVVIIIFFLLSRPLCDLFFDSSSHSAGFHFFRTYLLFSSGSLLMTVFKFMNEGLLRSSLRMKEYLLCNLGDLLIKIGGTWLLLQVVSTQAFWLGESLGRAFSMILSFYLIFRFQKNELLPSQKKTGSYSVEP